ncbi:MAG: GNAT family N-acetyltransferase [Labilithrix sp.]
MIRVEPLAATNVGALRALFEASHAPCFCRYWHFTGNKNEWLDRCAHRPEENAAELEAAVLAGDPGARGLVALEGDRAVGWLKLTPRAAVPKLRSLPVYRSLDLGDEHTTYAIGCMLVDPSFRHRGVAHTLVAAAPAAAKSWGAVTVEAYPRRSPHALSDEEAWQGPEAVFLAEGFEAVQGEPPYPVLRRST